MDRTLAIAVILVVLPVLIVWAMVISARARGPLPPVPESHKPVEVLVTDKLPYDEHRDEPAHAREQAHHANRPHFG